MENTSGYKLHEKYENIPLEFGSQILVNNGNITAEYAKKLLAHTDGQRYFAVIPKKADAAPDGKASGTTKKAAAPKAKTAEKAKSEKAKPEPAKPADDQKAADPSGIEVKDPITETGSKE